MLFYSILFDFIPYELANKGKGADWHLLGALAIVYDYTTNFHLLVPKLSSFNAGSRGV